MIYIYGLVCPINKNIRYIGKTQNIKQRYSGHLRDNSKTHKVNWIKSLKHKNLTPEIIILETLENDSDWQAKEKTWIAKAKENKWDLVNSTDGGDGVTNISGEGKERMLKTWKGRKHKPETLIKLSKASKGRIKTEEQKRKMSEIMKGREIKWVKKIVEKLKKFNDEQIEEIKTRLKNGERVCDLAKEFNAHRTTISKIKMGTYLEKYK